MRNLFCRVGSKTAIADTIIKLIPSHKIYVEPFVGSGAIYFHKVPSEKEVINDKDSELIEGYKLVKQVSADVSKYKNLDTLDKIKRFYNSTHTSKEDKLLYKILKFCNTFGSTGKGDMYKESDPMNKIKNITKYKERLKNTIIFSQDYKTIIKKYDSADTLFYLDPPYENSKDLYKNSEMDYNEMAKILSNIKGKFILSLNDSSNIINIFNKFKIKRITVKATGNNGIGENARRELLIMNF